MNPFVPPVGATAAVSGAPIIAAFNFAAGPNDSITLTGAGFTRNSGASAFSDTHFLTYGQSSAQDGLLTDAITQDNSASGSIITISPAEPAHSMYFVWAQNSAGFSTPVAINKTTAWWLSNSATSSPGQTISLYGENLSNGAASPQSWIYLQPTSGGAGQWASVTAVNPYKVDFTVPASLQAGTYQVWANNGLGGKYGWSAPLTMTVQAAASGLTQVINVKTQFGATGNGITDDGPAILRAIAASQQSGPVGVHELFFPAGTYLIANQAHLDIPSNLTLTGESAGTTILQFPDAPIDHGAGAYLISTREKDGTNVTFQDLTIQSTFVPTRVTNSNGQFWQRSGALIRERSGTNFTFDNVNIIGNSLTPIDWQGSSGVKLQNSTVVGIALSLLATHDVAIDHTQFFQRYEDTAALIIWGTHDISITNSTVQDFNNAATDGSGTGFGRFIENGLTWNSIYHEYVANNTTINLAARTADTTFNAGEQILMEGARDSAFGAPSAATGNTVTMDLSTFNPLHSSPFDPSWCFQNGMSVIVSGGTGIGQLRTITDISYVTPTGNPTDATSVTFTLDRPWAVVPDSTTHVVVTTTTWDSVFYQNTLQNSADAKGAALGASTGFEVYTGGYGLVFDSNITNNTHHGAMLTSGGNYNPVFFNEILNNQFNNSLVQGVVIGAVNRGGDPDLIGTVVRGNSVVAAAQMAINLSWLGIRSDTATLSIVEHNNISDSPIGMEVFDSPDVLAFDNTFTGSTPDAVAIAFNGTTPAIRLVQNKFQNYVHDYSGLLPANLSG